MPDSSDLILAVNAGSSSLKISLYRDVKDGSSETQTNSEPVELLLVSNITDISSPPASFSFSLAAHSSGREAKKESVDSIHDHASAFSHFLSYLQDQSGIDRSQIARVCHRVVHGGDYFDPVVITNKSFHHIEKLSDLAPLYVPFTMRLTWAKHFSQTQRRCSVCHQSQHRSSAEFELDSVL